MNARILALLIAAMVILCTSSNIAVTDTFGTGVNQFEIEFVKIGDPGNVADMTGTPNPAGSVDYIYSIGKFEISRDMVNKANAEGELAITMWDRFDFRPAMPAVGVSWNQAARFVNWLNVSNGFSPAYKFATQPRDAGYDANEDVLLWDLADAGYNAGNLFRNSQAKYFLPSVHEWYKAAYYDPDANGGAGGYWNFPTGSDSEPTAVASGTDVGTAVFRSGRPADITQAGGLSPYGVMGLGGNVMEWEETEIDLMNDNSSGRGLRGGNWLTNPNVMSARFRRGVSPSVSEQIIGFGFRVASIPEPSTLLLVMLGTVGACCYRPRH